ncbi:MAG: tail fiber domain-containing protein [Balneolaceae bacterium]|nr:tail fiber domain-containing protein [Balneolaceae bacterium]MBO6647399.1 tail fiber domain-containing protein [Balneolaceae bacterium]
MFIALFSVNIYAQVPQGFNFQAIARGVDGLPLINQELSVRISVLEGSETGTATYVETHTLTTNTAGLLQLVIGQGTPVESSFGDVNWSGFDNYVKLEIDPAGGTEFEELGTSQLLSVPYAILAENVVNGGSGGGFPLTINLNTADTDSSFIINIDGTSTAKPFQVFSKSTGFNGAVWGEAISDGSNPANQRGTYGMANGNGTGQHIGLFGGAVNFDGTGGSRTGAYGQAASKAKFNYGVRGLVQGDGSGDLVAVGEEVDGDFGSYNIGGGFYSSGNLNGNVGVEGIASGDDGSRINFGVIGTSRSTAEGFNVGVRGEARGSQSFNTALEGEANGAGTKNLGLRLNVYDGSSNIGMEVNADTAAILNGDVIINGALVHNGSSSGGGAVTKYDFDTTNPDSAFKINVTGPNNATGLISTATSDGINAGLEGHSDSGSGNDNLQVGTYGEAAGEGTGTHMGVYGVATGPESGSGDVGRRYGLYGSARSTGRENIGGFGIGRGAGDGEVIALGDEFAGGDFNVGGFNIGLVGFARDNVNGNVGIRGYVYGTEGGRENRGVSGEAVATGTGRNIGAQTITHSSQSDNIGFHALMFDDGSGNNSINNYGTRLEVNNQASGENIGLWASVDGVAPNNTGMKLEVSNGTTDNIGLIVNAATAAELNGNVFINGDLNYSGALNNTSDRNLKENIQPLQNGLETIMKLNPTTYNFRGNGEYNGLKLSMGIHYGLIAQEVEQVLPSLVKDNVHTYSESVNSTTGPNQSNGDEVIKTMDYKTMNYTELIPVLIKAVQEQQEEIDRLTKEVERLKSEKK